MNGLRSRLLTLNVQHDPALHRRWPFMRFGPIGVAVCWRGRLHGVALAPKFRGV